MAERHVWEAEERISQQVAHIGGLEGAGRPREADGARTVLDVMRASLEIARVHLVIARAWPDSQPDGP